MIRFAPVCVALGFAAAGSTALAAPTRPQPAMMTDALMDNVTAGALGDGLLTIVFQDSFNDWSVDFGGKNGGNAAAKAPFPGNGTPKGWENGKGNPHSVNSASSGSSTSSQSNTFLFQVNVIADVNAAIAGGDATAGQSAGTQTITATVPMPTQTLAASRR
jgi:hypothetical protein